MAKQLARRLAWGLTGGQARLTRVMARGLARVMAQGFARVMARGLTRGLARGLWLP